MTRTIGFIGFGEVGYLFAKGLTGAGATELAAYDIDLKSRERRARIEARGRDAGVVLADSIGDLADRSGLIISSVTSSVALAVARDAAAHLSARHVYVDLNSTAPMVKQEIGRVIAATGARFVEAAVMAAVPPLGLKTPMLLCGKAAGEVIERLAPYGMDLEDFGPEIGRASAAKMFRSVISKGLEALLLECALGAGRYGVTRRVLDYVAVGYPGIDWNELADFLLGRTAIHGLRRAHEMEEVAETLRSLGIKPFMSEAAAGRLMECAELGLKARFEDKPPGSYDEVIAAIEEARKD